MTLGGRIRSLRKSKKMTLVDLAGSEITKGMLSLIENDKSKPSMETLQHIAKTLDVSISYLTQEGDDEWTKSILEYEGFTDNFNFPSEFIEEEILTNLDKVAQNSNGMRVYHVLRVYYRMREEHETANAYTDKINNFYKGMGMEHLVVRNKLDDAISLMFSRDYNEAYYRILEFENEILEFKEYDSRIELDYLNAKGLFSINVDMGELLETSKEMINLSYELENFKYFITENTILGYYYGIIGDLEKHEEYQEVIKEYLRFNKKSQIEIDFIDVNTPIPIYNILVEDKQKYVRLYEEYIERIEVFTDKHPERQAALKAYRPIIMLELSYFKGDYQQVIEDYHDDMYLRPVAQYPLDRILMAIRSSVYPLSLHYAGRNEEARQEFNKIEETIEDIKDSVFTKELYMIRDIIFEQ